ncbi:hypothetical protein [Actinoplanes sp. DH11]|uniref:hypothetical protein n=1 Tax=Actinoplanes sp. DH11 TaxID=2857011 RepID=UPI001E3ECD37|nr:hypothetical protein [Actinoplanes sp. DH11]
MTARTTGRAWAYAGAMLGGAVSIAANVAHSFIQPQEDTTANWTPEPGAVVGAVVWPVFLFVAVEILARVAWPDGRIWQLIRWAGLLPVAIVAALVSYRHLSGLLDHYGEETLVCILGPLAVDGLMVMATGAILATGNQPHTPVQPARADDTTGAVTPEPPAAPALLGVPRPADDTQAATLAPVAPETARPARPVDIPNPDVVAARITRTERPRPHRPATEPRPTAATDRRPHTSDTSTDNLARPAADISVTEPDRTQLRLPLVPEHVLRRADQIAQQYQADNGTPITAGQLAARLKVNSDQAAEALAALRADHGPTRTEHAVNGSRPSKATR